MPHQKSGQELPGRNVGTNHNAPVLKEAVEWLDRAEQAREVAGQLTDPSAKKTVLELTENFDRLAPAAATPPCSGEGSWQKRNC
jgi:hypothetical protein